MQWKLIGSPKFGIFCSIIKMDLILSSDLLRVSYTGPARFLFILFSFPALGEVGLCLGRLLEFSEGLRLIRIFMLSVQLFGLIYVIIDVRRWNNNQFPALVFCEYRTQGKN
jgi:hypothetical protein